jgi:acetyl-CoA carboxylase carboxyltransferase component/acetyl/propionyl-CoA carboxylase alpha subunit
VFFGQVAIVDPGVAATRCLRSVQPPTSGEPAPRIVVLDRATPAPLAVRRQADRVLTAPLSSRSGAGGGPGTLDRATMTAWLDAAGVDAVWVGWGAPEEHAAIANACESQGVTFVGPTAAALTAIQDPTELARRLSGAGAPSAHRRAPPAAERLEAQLLLDHHGSTWYLGTVVHQYREDGRRVLTRSAHARLSTEQLAACERIARTTARALQLRGAVAVELTLPTATADAAVLDVRPHLTPAHLLTELLTGLDLVELQFLVAAGASLPGDAPTLVGHAASATLHVDEHPSGAPLHTGVAHVRIPSFPGLRCEPVLEPGEVVPTRLGTELVTLSTVDRDPARADRRLVDAVTATSILLGTGATDRAALLERLTSSPTRSSDAHGVPSAWEPTPASAARSALAIVAAAIELDEEETRADRERFIASAARGRPTIRADELRPIDLELRGHRYRGRISCTGPGTYDLSIDGHHLVAMWHRRGGPHRMVSVADRTAAVLVAVQGVDRLVEVDGAPFRVTSVRDGVVRARQPGIVLRFLVDPGDIVSAGDPMVVIEGMKLETVLSAPYHGRVDELLHGCNEHVAADDGLLRLEPLREDQRRRHPSPRASFDHLAASSTADEHLDADTRAAHRLRHLVLGFDRSTTDPGNLLRATERDGPAQDQLTSQIVAAEREVLQAFADVAALTSLQRGVEGGKDETGIPGDDLRTFLCTLDPYDEALAATFPTTLLQALRHLGVESLDRTAALEAGLYRLHLAQRRAPRQLRAILVLLGRWLDRLAPPQGTLATQLRATLDDLVRVADRQDPALGDLARRTRYHLFDRERLREERARTYAHVRRQLVTVGAEMDRDQRDALMAELVGSPEPLLPMLLDPEVSTEAIAPMLELLTRRYYRRRRIIRVRPITVTGHPTVVADVEDRQGRGSIIAAAGTTLPDVLSRTATLGPDEIGRAGRRTSLDAYLMWDGVPPDRGTLAASVLEDLEEAALPTSLRRVTVTTLSSTAQRRHLPAIQHLTFQRTRPGWVEQRHLRGIHPLVADRLHLWRFDRFELTRLPTTDEVFLFHAVARENAADVRLFALAEVRDLTASIARDGAISLPELERVLAACLDALRGARAALVDGERPEWNRIVLNLWPVTEFPLEQLEQLVTALSPLASGLGLEEITLLAQTPDAAGTPVGRCLRLRPGTGHGVSLRITRPPRQPLRPIDQLTSRVVAARRRGTSHPVELLPWLLTSPDAPVDATAGSFVEYDLDASGVLRPVTRGLGLNTAGIVVGVVSTPTRRYPDGLTRIALLSDPTDDLGSLAEAECRRIIAALDLATSMAVPIEWFPVSSGARVAMDSGTENLDWTARVLRRIIGYTQAGGEINIVVAGINVGAQPYWNAVATILMHTTGTLIMTPGSAMVLTGKRALELSGGVAAEDEVAIGGYGRVMGPNGQAQYLASDLKAACALLFRHYDLAYVAPGEAAPRRLPTDDPPERDVRDHPHPSGDAGFARVGDVFSPRSNPDRKKPFDIRTVLRAVADQDRVPLERWRDMADADTAVVTHAQLGGRPVVLLGIESRPLPRRGPIPFDGPEQWSAGTLFPRSSWKVARAINAASGRRPVVVLANLVGFDGSPESLRERQLEYGAEIGRAVVNFRGPIVFCVVSRFHGGAFVVFAKPLNPSLEVVAVEGSHASVIGGAPAAAVVFTREVDDRTRQDPRVIAARARLVGPSTSDPARDRATLERLVATVQAEHQGAVAAEFDRTHDIHRAVRVGSVDRIIPAAQLRPRLIDAVERGLLGAGQTAMGNDGRELPGRRLDRPC